VALDEAGDQRRLVEVALETADFAAVTAGVRAAVEGYNKDDCRSVAELRRWLELRRSEEIARGAEIPRPPVEPDEPSEEVSARQQRIDALRSRLVGGVPVDPDARTPDQQARHLLAYLLDWHYREDKVVWWEYFRLLGLSAEDLVEESNAVVGLELVERVEVVVNRKTGKPTGSVVDRYRYPAQDCEIRARARLTLRDGSSFGEVVGADRMGRTLDVKKGPAMAERHPRSAFTHERYSPDEPAAALFRLGEAVASDGFDGAPPTAVDLLLRRPPTVEGGLEPSPGTSVSDHAVSVVGRLKGTTLAIQGPPGSGKTHTGARMILALVKNGKRVGVTGTSHKVIRNMLDAVANEASNQGLTVRLGHKVTEAADETGAAVLEIEGNDAARAAISERTVDVLGGTAWLWSRAEFACSVDVLFIDEAGQMSLGNALAVSQAADTLVLLGDPQQLEQPQKASHPDGVGVSALDHVLDGRKTMGAGRGLFLPVTWRLAPGICGFTSEVFYEGKLTPKNGLERQQLSGAGRLDGSGLVLVEVDHDGCQSASDEEAEAVGRIVDELVGGDVRWIDWNGEAHVVTPKDLRVVAPYNAHVRRLQERLAQDIPVGTVDKFQGQEAPVVIYSMASSQPEDAPRGMEFLYSPNRLNVATSRARCLCIVVASPRLFEPECHTPRQMLLANAFARYRELARRVSLSADNPQPA
jgi:uncharacterized protein